MVPFVRSCLREGHQVLVAAPHALRARAVATGASFWPVDSPSSAAESASQVLPATQGDADAWRIGLLGQLFGRLRSTASTARICEAVRGWAPDVLVRESSEFGAAVAAEVNSLPHARVVIGLGAMEEMWIDLATPAVDQLRQAYGLRADPTGERLRAAPYLTFFPEKLEDPARPAPPQVQRFMDPQWKGTASPSASRPLVYVTFGTLAATMPTYGSIYMEAMDALGDFQGDVVLTVGWQMDLATLSTPANVRVERWLDQREVLAHASGIVCHGGGGTTLGALAAGLPLVVVPLFAPDQHLNAHQVAAVGAGVIAAPNRLAIRSSLEEVLIDPSYRASARRIASDLQRQRSPDQPGITQAFLRS
jgi:hypothetical protein